MRAIIVTGGSPVKPDIIKEYFNAKSDYLICADGGLNYVDELGLIPNLIVGDLDSVKKELVNKYKDIELIKFNPEKDFTDTELAINQAIEKGYNDITMFCATGTRLDHTLANIGLIENYSQKGIILRIIDNNNYIMALENNMKLNRIKDKYVSIIPLSKEIKGLTLVGFKYPLSNYTVKRGTSLCISNEIVSDIATINYKEGIGILIISRD